MIGAVVCMALVQVCVIIWVTKKLNDLLSLIGVMEETLTAQTELDKILVERYYGNEEKDGRDGRKEAEEEGATTK